MKTLMASPIPIDRTAAKVAFAKGDEWRPTIRAGRYVQLYTDGPPTCPPRPKDAKDWKGYRRGRVVAFAWQSSTKANGAKWVCKCDCGNYVVRRVTVWASKKECDDMCDMCASRRKALKPWAKVVA